MNMYTAQLIADENGFFLDFVFSDDSDSCINSFSQKLTKREYNGLKSGRVVSHDFDIPNRELTETDIDGEYHLGTWIQTTNNINRDGNK